MPAPEKAVMGGQRRRMRRLQHQMAAGIDFCRLLLRMAAPQHEHGRRMAAVHLGHHRIGERLPPLSLWDAARPISTVSTLLSSSTPCSAQCSRKPWARSEEHTSELQSLMRISYAVFCLKKK